MKQTLTINLNQIIFNIDNDAYEVLSDYLKSIEKYFKKETDGEEIINDIEARIAEKFSDKLNKRKSVINLSDVQSIIEEMGTVEDITSGNYSENEEENPEIKPTKKLFRDVDKKIFGGVAAGLAQYFGIDISLMRIIFLILFIPMHGFLILTYLIMWVIVPKVEKSSDKLLMKGQKVTLSSLKTTALEEKKMSQKLKRTAYITSRVITGIMGFPLVFGMAISIGIVAFTITQIIINHDLVDTTISELAFIKTVPFWQFTTLFISLGFIIIIPLIFILKLGITLLRQKSNFRTVGSIVLIALWFLSLSVFAGLGGRNYLQNKKQISKTIEKIENGNLIDESIIREEKIENFDKIKISGALKVSYKYDSDHKIKIIGQENKDDQIEFDINNHVLNVRRKIIYFPFLSKVRVEVYGPELEKISLSGSSNLTLENVATKKLEIEISGASKIIGNGFANDFSLKSSGASSVKLFDLETDNTSIDTSGASKIEIAVNKTLNISSSGASKISYKGDPAIKQQLSGASKIERILQ